MSGAVTAAVIGGTIAAGAGIAGSAIQANAAGKAADTQAQTAQQAQQYQQQATQQALQYQQQQYGQSQQNLAPYMQAGTGAQSALSYLLGTGPAQGQTPQSATPMQGNSGPATNVVPNAASAGGTQQVIGGASPGSVTSGPGNGAVAAAAGGPGVATGSSAASPSGNSAASGVSGAGSLLTPYQDFSAPTGLTMENDPGYQARLQLGTDALQHSAAASGSLLTGGTAKALDTYAQDYASNEYGNVYNRALQGYQTNAANYYTGQNNAYSRLMGVAQNGQSAAMDLSGLGQSGANSMASTLMSGTAAANQQANNAAAATASGYQNQGNIWGSALSGAGNNFGSLYATQNAGNPYQTLYNAQNAGSQGVQTSPISYPSQSIPTVPYQSYQF